LQLVRDTRVSTDDAPCSVIASAAKIPWGVDSDQV
jgi:hypothetical protein